MTKSTGGLNNLASSLALSPKALSHEPISPTARVKIETAISVIVDEHTMNTVGEMCQKLDAAG